MKVVLIAPVSAEQQAEIAAVDPRIEVEDAWDLFEAGAGGRLAAPDHRVVPAASVLVDARTARSLWPAGRPAPCDAEAVCITFPPPLRIASRAPKLRFCTPDRPSLEPDPGRPLAEQHPDQQRARAGTLPIAEWAIAVTMALAKELPRAFGQRAVGTLDRAGVRGRQIAGKTLAVVGLGGIGRAARLGRALGMRVIGTRRSAEPVEHVERLYAPSELHEVLGQSDVVVVASQLTAETHHLMDAAAFAAMKRGAFLVNVARGELIDEAALADALRSGQIGGFAADVYEGEFDHGRMRRWRSRT